jgi:hypothetical protein
MPSAGLPRPRYLQKSKSLCQATARVLAISTQQVGGGIPLFFWHNDLFLRIKSLLFACISCTSLWYWAKAPSSLDYIMAACFLALLSSFSSASARSTVSPNPWSISDFCRDLSTTSCTRQRLFLGYSVMAVFDYSRVLSRTFIHCSVRRIDSKFRATVAESMRLSDRSSSPP